MKSVTTKIFRQKIIMNLIELFSKIKDFRRAEGKRYPLTAMLVIVMMSIICGHYGYREIARFAKANREKFKRYFNLKRSQMPTHVTFRRFIQEIDFQQVNQVFEEWIKNYVQIDDKEWFAIDGKAIRSTVKDYDKSYQNFVSMVSIFGQKRGQVIKIAKLHNSKTSEIPTVEQLIKTLDLEGLVLSMDALHCQKKL